MTLNLNLKTDLAMNCGGSVTVYMEPHYQEKRLIIFGAGHICLKLTPFAKKLGMFVVITDERAKFATAERLPDADQIVVKLPADFIAEFDFKPTDSVVIITHGHGRDLDILRDIVDIPLDYIGMIGSERKVDKTFKTLEKEGVNRGFLDTIHAPIGLGIKADTPTEIAILIAAELVQQKYLPSPKISDQD